MHLILYRGRRQELPAESMGEVQHLGFLFCNKRKQE